MKHKRVLAFVLAAILVLLAFAACGEKKATATFKDGDTVVKTVEKNVAETLTKDEIPAGSEKDGYRFDGWYVGDTKVEAGYVLNEDVTATAKYTQLIKVTFDKQDTQSTITVPKGEQIGDRMPADPAGEGFLGWYVGDVRVDATYAPTADVTVVAKFETVQSTEITVTFKNGETVVATVTVNAGEAIGDKLPADLTEEGFLGWYVGDVKVDAAYVPTADVTAEAKIEAVQPTTVTVTFQNGETVVSSVTVTVGETVGDQLPADLTEKGFLGWYVGDVKVDAAYAPTENVTVLAKFADRYTVTFRNGEKVETVIVLAGEALGADMPADPANTETAEFVGWYIGELKIDATYVPTADVTVDVKFVGVLTVIFKNGDTVVGTVTLVTGVALGEMPEDPEEGGFLGWYAGDVKIDAGYVPTADMTVEAKFEVRYTVTVMNGSSEVVTFTVLPGEALGDNLPTKLEELGFVGWYVDRTQVDGTYVPTGDVVVRAKFVPVYTVTVKNGNQVLDSFSVVYGDALGEKMPADLTEKGFDGWYIGDRKIDATYLPSENVTIVAKFTDRCLVLFEVDGVTVISVQVKLGEAIPEDMLPSDADYTKDGFKLIGWFNGDEELDEEAPVTEDVVYTAKWERNSYEVIFQNGSDLTTVYVPFGGTLASANIPAAPAGNGVFVGWYAGAVKAEGGLTVSSDMTFEPAFVDESAYSGAWYSDEAQKYVVFFVDTNGKKMLNMEGYSNQTYSYDTKTGTVSFSEGAGYGLQKWTFLAVGEDMIITYSHYDMYEELEELSYALTKGQSVSFSGTYRRDNSGFLIVEDGGVITNFSGGSPYYARMLQDETGYRILLRSTSYNELKSIPVSIDENNNIIITGIEQSGIYVKNSGDFANYYNSEKQDYLYVFTVGGKQVMIFREKAENASYYATVTGTIAEGSVVTVSYNGKSVKIKIEGGFKYPGNEQGTYSKDGNTLSLDGFGNADLNGVKSVYTYYEKTNTVVTAGVAYVINSENHSYGNAERIGYEGVYINLNNRQYALTLDGFGNALLVYTSSYGGFTEYSGSYSVNGTKLVISGLTYGYYGSYAIEEDGSVLTLNSVVFAVEGYEVVSRKEELNGSWVAGDNTLEIDTESETPVVKFNGSLVSNAKLNWNGSAVSFTAKDSCGLYPSNTTPYTAAVADGTIILTHDCCIGLDEDGYAVTEPKSVTYEKSESGSGSESDLDAFAGTWITSMNRSTLIFDGKGTVVFNGTALPYTLDASGKVASFVCNGEDYVCTLTGETDMRIDYTYDYSDYNMTATKQ